MKKLSTRPLEVFAANVLKPAVARTNGLGSTIETSLAFACLCEAFLWIELGVKLGVYPFLEAEAVMLWTLPVVRRFGDTFAHWYLFPGLKERLLYASSTKRVLDPNDASISSAQSVTLTRSFQLAALELARFFDDQPAQAITSVLVFADEPRWQTLTYDEPASDAIMDSMLVEYDPWLDGYRPLVYAGWFSLVRHIEGLIAMFDTSETSKGSAVAAWTLFKYEVAAFHGWCFNVRNLQYRERFKTISRILGSAAFSSMPDYQIHRSGIESYGDQLIQRWINMTEPSVAATAG